MQARLWLILGSALLCVGLIAPGSGSPARAFQISVHDGIIDDALKDVTNDAARDAITGHLLLGTGAAGVDLDQVSAEKHFDSARDPIELCRQWEQGFQPTLVRAVSYALTAAVNQAYGNYGTLSYPDSALDYFGRAAHAVQDFYSHSNWVELHQNATTDLPLTQAPIVGATCDPAAFRRPGFSEAVQTGYASLQAYLWLGGWCPPGGPPRGYRYCHDTLAKDEPDHGHGKEYPTGDRPTRPGERTYHEMARALSVQATRDLWQLFRDNVIVRIEQDARLAGFDAECLFRGIARLNEETSTCARCPAPAGGGALRESTVVRSAFVAVGEPSPLVAGELSRAAQQPASCPAPSTLAGSYGAVSGLQGRIIDAAATGEVRWGPQGEPVTLSRGEARMSIREDGTATGGTLLLEATKAGGRTGRFEGTVDTSSFTVAEDPSNGLNPAAIFGHVHFRGPARFCDPGRNPACREFNASVRLDYVFEVRDLRPTGALLLCIATNIDRCRADPLGTLTSSGGSAGGTSGGSAPGAVAEVPQVPTWAGTFNSSRGPMRLTVSGFRVSGTFGPAPQASTAGSDIHLRRDAGETNVEIRSAALQPAEGTLEGVIMGNRLRGTWSGPPSYQAPDDAGDIDFALSADGASFDGRWSVGGGEWRTDWTGTRTTGAAPQTLGPSVPSGPPSPCPQWDITGGWQTQQGNNYHPGLNLQQRGTAISGTAALTADEQARAGFSSPVGTVSGTLIGDRLDITITWQGRAGPVVGQYTGTISEGRVSGQAGGFAWSGTGSTRCIR